MSFGDISSTGASAVYTENAVHAGGTLAVCDGTHSETITMVGAGLAGNFHVHDHAGHVDVLWV
jgi:hypothetical protein